MTDVRPPHRQQPWSEEPVPEQSRQSQPWQAGPPPGWSQPPAGMGTPPPGWTPPPPPRPPSNSAAVVALVLGIVALVLSVIPIINQMGIIAGILGVVFGLVGIILGAKRHYRLVMAIIATVLCIAGTVMSIVIMNSFVSAVDQAFAPVTNSAAPSSSGGTAAPPVYTLKVTGSASRANVNFSADGSSGSAESVAVPFEKVLAGAAGTSFHSASITAMTPIGTSGDVTCTITDQTGAVLNTKTATSQGGQFGSAMVMCNAFG